jgi:hypothetical protein
MTTPARDRDKFWILRFITCSLASAMVAFAVTAKSISVPSQFDFSSGNEVAFVYLYITGAFFPLFVPALTGIAVSSLWFNLTESGEEEPVGIIPRLTGFISSIFTVILAAVTAILATAIVGIYHIGFERPFSNLDYTTITGFYAICAGLIGAFSSVLFRKNIVVKFLIIFSLIPAKFAFSLFQVYTATSIIYHSFYGLIFAALIDEWMNLYSKLLSPKFSRFYSTLTFFLMVLSGMLFAIYLVKKPSFR